jgi:hypothetical protein
MNGDDHMNRDFWIGIILAFAPVPDSLLAQELYKHVDENGKITYSDRPQEARDKVENPGSPNVASPEARQQMYEEECRNRQETRHGMPRSHEQRERQEAENANCVSREMWEKERFPR